MGWTHYWKRSTELPREAFSRAVDDLRVVLPALDVDLAGFDGSGTPILGRDAIVFNGEGKSRCEPFEVHRVEVDRHGRSSHWTSCKTNHAPYDIAVRVVLVILAHHLGDSIRVSSDGGKPDWDEAVRMCSKLLGYGEGFQLAVENAQT